MTCQCQKMSHLQADLCVALSQYRLISIQGEDAEKYLQGQLTTDVSKLAIGEQTISCHCDPKGKMSAIFRLCRYGADHFFIVIRHDLLPSALDQLKKYAVFSKVTFAEQDTPLYGTTSDALLRTLDQHATIFHLQSAQARAIFWHAEPITNGESELWDLADIQDGIPLLQAANQFELIPQATNLQQLEQAISFTKGCYIGQETVARAKYRGANKRAMFTFVGSLSSPVQANIGGNIEVQLGEHWKATGTILAAVTYQQQLWLQVVLNKELEENAQYRLAHVALQQCALPYSLEEA